LKVGRLTCVKRAIARADAEGLHRHVEDGENRAA
jgi:hypothetical protein